MRAEPRSKLIAIVSCASFSSSSVKGARFIRLARAGSLKLCSAIWRRRAAVNVVPACSTPCRLLMRSPELSVTWVVEADASMVAS